MDAMIVPSYDFGEARNFFQLSNLETALDLSARFLTPFQDSDTRTLTFGLIALIMSSVVAWVTADDDLNKAKENQPLYSNMDISENTIQNRNGLDKSGFLYSKERNEINKLQPIRKKITINDYKTIISAYEEFMTWARNETDGGRIDDSLMLEEVLELAISKARGIENPADKLYKFLFPAVYDAGERVYDYIMWFFS